MLHNLQLHSFPKSFMAAPLTSSDGADSSGLIYGFQFGASGHGVAITAEEALQWLDQPAQTAPAGFVWLHFNLAQASTERWLREHVQLSDVFYESLKDGSRSTRVELDDDTLVAVVNDVNYDFAFEPSDISTLWLTVGPRLVVSARLQALRSIDGLRDAVKKGITLRSSVELLAHLMHGQGDVLVNIVRVTTARVDEIEDHLLSGKLEKKRAEPAALFRLLKMPPDWIEEPDLEDLRQSTEEFNVALSDMAALQERIKLLQEEIAGRVAEANNRSLFVLTIVTVLALPINIIAGLFGMNVGGIPLAEHSYGFWIVVAIIMTFSVFAGWFAFRQAKS